MKKLLILISFVLSFSAIASVNFQCINNNTQLSIKITKSDVQKMVSWTIKLIDEESTAISGSGIWQKEIESKDAFSSFDTNSAISFQNNKAVFVMDSNQAIFFPLCKKL